MAKKSFAAGLAAKLQQEQAADLDKRFDTASEALSDRKSLMHAPTPSNVERNAEQLVQAGKGTLEDITLPIDVLDDNPLNSRSTYDQKIVLERATSIAADGQLFRVLVTPNPAQPGRYILLDGQYRKRAKKHLNHPTIDCRVIKGLNKVDFYRLSKTANDQRTQESILDNALGYRKLLDQGLAKTDDDLAEISGESRPKINKMLAITDLPKPVLDVIAEHPASFGVSNCYELTLYNKVVGAEKTHALAKRIVDDELPFSKVEAIRKKAEEGTKTTRNTSRQYKVQRSGIAGTIKEWDNGRVSFDVMFDDAAKREEYVANLKHQFELDDGQAE